jgi:hypothetical protein
MTDYYTDALDGQQQALQENPEIRAREMLDRKCRDWTGALRMIATLNPGLKFAPPEFARASVHQSAYAEAVVIKMNIGVPVATTNGRLNRDFAIVVPLISLEAAAKTASAFIGQWGEWATKTSSELYHYDQALAIIRPQAHSCVSVDPRDLVKTLSAFVTPLKSATRGDFEYIAMDLSQPKEPLARVSARLAQNTYAFIQKLTK